MTRFRHSGFSRMPFFGGVVGVNQCRSGDDSFYCSLSRFTSSVMMILFLCFILFYFYKVIKPRIFGSK